MADISVLMTIADVNRNSGGPSKSATALAQALTRNIAGVSLHALDSGQELILPRDKNLPFELVLWNAASSFLERRQALREMRAGLLEKVSTVERCIIHNHGVWLGVNRLAAKVSRLRKKPFVVSTRGMLEPWAMNYRKRKKQIAWFLYQKRDLETATLLHATAEQEAINLRHLGLRQPIAVIPNGVDLPHSAAIERSSKKTILFLSRIHPKKGLANLVDAFSQIRPLDWQVIIAGPEENGHQQEIIERVNRLGLTEQFQFLGPVYDEEKWRLYASADLFVLPSFSENFGIVIAEALAAEVPVITTMATPWRDLVTYNCGWWVDVGVEPLVDGLRKAIRLTDEERHSMGKQGRTLIENSYSWAKIADDMTDTYTWILGGGSPPACVMTD